MCVLPIKILFISTAVNIWDHVIIDFMFSYSVLSIYIRHMKLNVMFPVSGKYYDFSPAFEMLKSPPQKKSFIILVFGVFTTIFMWF